MTREEARASSIVSRRNRSSEGGMPRGPRRAAYGEFASGSAIRLAHAAQEARLHDHGGADARSGSGANAVLLRSLPFPEPDRLVTLRSSSMTQEWPCVVCCTRGPNWSVRVRDRHRTRGGNPKVPVRRTRDIQSKEACSQGIGSPPAPLPDRR